MIHQKLELILRAYDVDRFHTCPLVERETVAQHSYLVAMLCQVLTDGGASAALLTAALMHDLAESELGDIPSPTKRALKEYVNVDLYEEKILRSYSMCIPPLTAWEGKVLKAADNLAGLLKVQREITLGNRHKVMRTVKDNFTMYLTEMLRGLGEKDDLRERAYTILEEINRHE